MDPPVPTVSARNLPKHVGIILDGNGRWAQARALPRTDGHRIGADAVRRVVRAARRLGLEVLTLYSFSVQNWNRPIEEVESLMHLLHDFLVSEREEILENGIRLTAIGEPDRLPGFVRDTLVELVESSRHNDRMVLCLALSYGGREEILAAARALVRRATDGDPTLNGIDEATFRALLPSVGPGDPDLIIRTGGELRLSNFLLWGSAYAELYFTAKLWPDFGEEDLYAAIADYQDRERRFGGVEPRR
jgi:undecaprenyl diphosphate synthase